MDAIEYLYITKNDITHQKLKELLNIAIQQLDNKKDLALVITNLKDQRSAKSITQEFINAGYNANLCLSLLRSDRYNVGSLRGIYKGSIVQIIFLIKTGAILIIDFSMDDTPVRNEQIEELMESFGG